MSINTNVRLKIISIKEVESSKLDTLTNKWISWPQKTAEFQIDYNTPSIWTAMSGQTTMSLSTVNEDVYNQWKVGQLWDWNGELVTK